MYAVLPFMAPNWPMNLVKQLKSWSEQSPNVLRERGLPSTFVLINVSSPLQHITTITSDTTLPPKFFNLPAFTQPGKRGGQEMSKWHPVAGAPAAVGSIQRNHSKGHLNYR